MLQLEHEGKMKEKKNGTKEGSNAGPGCHKISRPHPFWNGVAVRMPCLKLTSSEWNKHLVAFRGRAKGLPLSFGQEVGQSLLLALTHALAGGCALCWLRSV